MKISDLSIIFNSKLGKTPCEYASIVFLLPTRQTDGTSDVYT